MVKVIPNSKRQTDQIANWVSLQIFLLARWNICPLARILALIGTAEANSEHPIGVAITTYVKKVCL